MTTQQMIATNEIHMCLTDTVTDRKSCDFHVSHNSFLACFTTELSLNDPFHQAYPLNARLASRPLQVKFAVFRSNSAINRLAAICMNYLLLDLSMETYGGQQAADMLLG